MLTEGGFGARYAGSCYIPSLLRTIPSAAALAASKWEPWSDEHMAWQGTLGTINPGHMSTPSYVRLCAP